MEVPFTFMEVNLLTWKYPWKLIPPTSTEGKQLPWKHQIPWKLPRTSMKINLLPFTSIVVAMEVASFNNFIYFGSFHQLPWTLQVGQFPWR